MGFLGVRFEVGGLYVKLPPSIILVRSMLGTSNLGHKYIRICSFRFFSSVFSFSGGRGGGKITLID